MTIPNYPTSQSNCDCNHPINHRSATCRVNITQSPYLHVFYNQHPLRLTIDSGAETNKIKASLANYIGCPISKSSQLALQADGRTPLSIVGETRLSLSRNGKTPTLEALVVEDLDVDILAGTPFVTCNDIAVRPTKHEIIIAGSDIVPYGSPNSSFKYHVVRYCNVLRAPPTNTTIVLVVSLRLICLLTSHPIPNLLLSHGSILLRVNQLSLPMHGPNPVFLSLSAESLDLSIVPPSRSLLKRIDHICQARLVMSSSPPQTQVPSSQDLGPPPLHTPGYHSEQIFVDPDEKLNTLSLSLEGV